MEEAVVTSCCFLHIYQKVKVMSKVNQEVQKSLRIVIPLDLYAQVKVACPEHGQISQLVRALLMKHFLQLAEAIDDN